MKITYNFVNGETIAVEVNEEIGRVILEMKRLEDNEERRIRYNERHIDSSLDHGKWNEYIQPEFDDELQELEERRIKNQEIAEKAIASLNEKQKDLVISIYGKEKLTEEQYAKKIGRTQGAVSCRLKTIRKKLKKVL